MSGYAVTGWRTESAVPDVCSAVSRGVDEVNVFVEPARKAKTGGTCGAWAVLSECEKRLHKFAKRIYCGKEWCEVCGTHRSASHNRKIARILPKAMQIETMGYLVIEFPEWCRHLGSRGINPDSPADRFWCYSKPDLQETTNTIVRVLGGKRTATKWRSGGYFSRGLVRWHWFGDKIPGKYNPHVNVLVDGAYIEPDVLEKIKADLRTALNVPDLIVNYSYCDMPAKMFHKVEYITRATFLDREWDPYIADELFNFRNQRWWGQWHDEPAWTVNEATDEDESELLLVAKLQEGKCPCCNDGTGLLKRRSFHTGKMVAWSKPVDSTWLIIWGARELAGTGYYIVPNGDNGPRGPSHALTIYDIIHDDRSKDHKNNIRR